MKRKFNDTGLCVPHRHYMVDTSAKIEQIIQLVEAGEYFTINRPRQFGKTTTLPKARQSEAVSGLCSAGWSVRSGGGMRLFIHI